jgi:hypothetical protein
MRKNTSEGNFSRVKDTGLFRGGEDERDNVSMMDFDDRIQHRRSSVMLGLPPLLMT